AINSVIKYLSRREPSLAALRIDCPAALPKSAFCSSVIFIQFSLLTSARRRRSSSDKFFQFSDIFSEIFNLVSAGLLVPLVGCGDLPSASANFCASERVRNVTPAFLRIRNILLG